MLYMVIERFKNPDLREVGARFKSRGRMMPEGERYLSSWLEPSGQRRFQLMESPSRALMDEWISHWSDLCDVEVIEVLESAAFWARRAAIT